MARVSSDRILTSVDVGTTKICVLVAQQLDGNHVEVIGVGKAPSHGLSKGVVVDISKTVHSISSAIKEAELMAGVRIESASIGVSGAHIASVNSHGVVPIKRGEVCQQDVANALAAARAIVVHEGQQILHVLPQYFTIDGRERVHDPIGMCGVRLEVQAHIILGAIASVQNLVKCCEATGITVNDIVLEQLASAEAVLSPDERTLGVGVLDIGGGTADLAIYQNNAIRYTKVLPVAGNHFTSDVAIGLRTTLADAERSKKEHGAVTRHMIEDDELVEVACVEGTQTQIVYQRDLLKILQPRAQELLGMVQEEITTHQLHHFISVGMVLTGGGSLLAGMDQLATEMLGMPTRIGHPHVEFCLPALLQNPMYATGYGLILHSLNKRKNQRMSSMSGSLANRVLSRMKLWVLDFF